MIYLLKMVMFHGYVKVPEGSGEYPRLVISPFLCFTNNEQTHFSNLYELYPQTWWLIALAVESPFLVILVSVSHPILDNWYSLIQLIPDFLKPITPKPPMGLPHAWWWNAQPILTSPSGRIHHDFCDVSVQYHHFCPSWNHCLLILKSWFLLIKPSWTPYGNPCLLIVKHS